MVRAALIVVSLLAGSAHADRWRFNGKVGTEFPLALGAKIDAEAPFGLRLSTGVGFLPGPYLDALDGIVGFNDQTARLVRSSLSHSVVWRTHAGYRPWPDHGFYAMGGYGLVLLGGGSTASEIIETATGMQLPESDRGAPRALTVEARLHMLDVEAGWLWTFYENLELQISVGGAFTIGAASSIAPDYKPAMPEATRAFAANGESFLNRELTGHVFVPVVTVMVGYPF